MNMPVLILVLGILVVLISLLADVLGIGVGGGMGWKQLLGVAVGIVLVIIGGVMRSKSVKPSSSA